MHISFWGQKRWLINSHIMCYLYQFTTTSNFEWKKTKHTWLINWNKSWIICLSVCGSIRQGSCSKYELRNISSDNVDFLPEAVAANDAVSTTFAFIGPQRYNRWGQGNVLYVGTTYTPHGDYRHDVPAISSRNLINLRFAEYSVSKQVIRLINP